jgi:hypothetical protein
MPLVLWHLNVDVHIGNHAIINFDVIDNCRWTYPISDLRRILLFVFVEINEISLFCN